MRRMCHMTISDKLNEREIRGVRSVYCGLPDFDFTGNWGSANRPDKKYRFFHTEAGGVKI